MNHFFVFRPNASQIIYVTRLDTKAMIRLGGRNDASPNTIEVMT